ncbi:hypothetical protein AB0J82_25275 [Asanoa sp. NPDC049518]|uniref:hypothetical protein n=1 Tax=unclassified Asanoa TaxID=2685164 RepID=UPI00342DF809
MFLRPLAILLPGLALIGAFLAYRWAAESFEKVGGAEAAYVRHEANLRSCPRLSCDVSAALDRGQQLIIVRAVDGEVVEGQGLWFEVRYGDTTRFVHSLTVTSPATRLADTLDPLVTIVGFLAVLVLFSMTRLQQQAADSRYASDTDRLLFGGVAAVGIAALTAGYVMSRLNGAGPGEFMTDALTNLGAGLLGAAVTFVLFQSLLARRAPTAQAVATISSELSDLSALGVRLDRRLDALHSELTELKAAQTRHRNGSRWSAVFRWLGPR